MKNIQKIFIFLTRVSIGWLFFYAGITKVLNPEWTSKGYLEGAKNLTDFYSWLTQAGIINWVDSINQWGLTLIGLSLILGLFVRWSAVLGAIIMILYYIPILDFPYPNPHSMIVDEHIIYALTLLTLATLDAGKYFGLDRLLKGGLN